MTKKLLSVFCNLFVFAAVALCMLGFFTRGGEGNMQVVGVRAFQYFTVDSNVLCALACLCTAGWELRRLRSDAPIPRWLNLFKFVGTVAVSLTCFTVLFFLGPLYGYGPMLAGRNFFLHLLCPLAAMFSFAVLERTDPAPLPLCLLGLLPTVVYGTVYFTLVILAKRWRDFYGFNRGGHWYLSAVLMLLATLLLSAALWTLNHRRSHPKVRL